MRVGVCASGVGAESTGAFVQASAIAAEQAGFSTIWIGEHVVLFEAYPNSDYPYAGFQGSPDVPMPDPTTPIIDPLIAMSWAAAATKTIEVGTGILILPQRNPVVLAKQLATLDAYCGGRVVLGAGLGWCREEYDAVGIPWQGRGRRMDEYVGALRTLLEDDASTYHGETVDFERAYLYPKPAREGGLPIIVGGESDAALRRVARCADGWIAYKLDVEEAPERIALLRRLTEEEGRDPGALRIVVAIFDHTSPDEMARYAEAGVTDFNLVIAGQLPLEEPALSESVGALGERFVGYAATL
jgi:probable F420-dependent oxidoreductase